MNHHRDKWREVRCVYRTGTPYTRSPKYFTSIRPHQRAQNRSKNQKVPLVSKIGWGKVVYRIFSSDLYEFTVGPPFDSFSASIRFGKLMTKLSIMLCGKAANTSTISVRSCSTSDIFLLKHVFLKIAQKCSMGLRSGDRAGQLKMVTSCFSRNCIVELDLWHDALSCMKIRSGYFLRSGMRVFSSIAQ